MSNYQQNQISNSNDVEIELVLKIKRPCIIDKDTTVSEMKQIVKNVFKSFGRNFILMAGENDLTSLDKLGLIKTMDYYKSNSITIVPDNYNISSNSDCFNSIADNMNSQRLYKQNFITTDECDIKFKENEFYRRSINTACLDLDDLKNHLMSINISKEDDNLGKASLLLRKTDDIIDETNKFLRKYHIMCGGLSYEHLNIDKNIPVSQLNNTKQAKDKNINQYNNVKGTIYTYDNYTPNRNIKKIILPSTDKKFPPKVLKSVANKSTKADSDRKFQNNNDNDQNTVYTFRNSGNNSNRGSRENSKTRNCKSPARNDSLSRKTSFKEENLDKLKTVVKKTEINLLKEENEYLKETIDVLTKNINELQFKIIQTENELRYIKEKEINEITIKYNNINEKYLTSNKNNQEMQGYLDKLENSIKSLKNERENILEKLSYIEEDSINLNNQVKNLDEDNKKLNKEKEFLEKTIENLKLKLEELNKINMNQKEPIIKTCEDNNNYFKKLKDEIDELNENIKQKNYEIVRLVNENRIFHEKLNSKNSKEFEEYEELVKKLNDENSEIKLENSKFHEFLFTIKTKILQIQPSEIQFFSLISDSKFDLKPLVNKITYELEEIEKEKEIISIRHENLKSEIEAKKASITISDTENLVLISNKRSMFELQVEELKQKLEINKKILDDKLAEPKHEYCRLACKNIPNVLSTYFSSISGKRVRHNQENFISNFLKTKETVRNTNLLKNSDKLGNKLAKIQLPEIISSNTGNKENILLRNEINLNISNIDHKNSNNTSKKLMKIKDYTDPDNSDFIEINADLLNSSELKTIARVRPSSKAIEVSEGAVYLFRVYDKKSILRFDIENREFRVIEFADYGNFEENFNPNGSIYLNTLNGLFIVTGKNNDMFYFYIQNTNSMIKLAKLNDNHTFGSLIYYPKGNSLICLSGWHNKKVENYYNDELISGFLTNKNAKIFVNQSKSNNLKKTWSYLPEMKTERGECPYLIINESYLYSFFGYNCPTDSYIENIEYLNLESQINWEEIKIKKNDDHLSARIKSHTAICFNKNNLLFFGGYDGTNDEPIENFFELNLEEMSLSSIGRKYRDINQNHFYNFQQDSSMIPFIDFKDRKHFACFDENDRIHAFDLTTMNYDIFYFD